MYKICKRRWQKCQNSSTPNNLSISYSRFHSFSFIHFHSFSYFEFMLIFPNVTCREFLSGYISLYQASRISRPLDIALTLCQCSARFSVSILFFFKEPTFLERAPGGSHPSGGPHLAGRASFQKKGNKNKKAENTK